MDDPLAHPDAPGIVRGHFVGTDLGEVEQYLRATYTEMALHRPGTHPGDVPDAGPGCWLRHDVLAAPQAGVAVNHLVNAAPFSAQLLAPRYLAVMDLGRGRLEWSTRRHGQVRLAAGELALSPAADGAFAVTFEPTEAVIVILDRSRVADYAAHVCGLDAAPLEFDALAPRSPALSAHWRATLAHVRDDMFANPIAATSPIILESAFRLLAAALLTVFPNTALDAATDPTAAGTSGAAGAAGSVRLREVVDYLDAHAGDPVRPADVARVADVPYRDVAAGLRRHHGTDPDRLLWTARLRGARRDLLAADPDADDAARLIAAVAARWGFTHPGRFAVAYTTAHDQSPEDTLRDR